MDSSYKESAPSAINGAGIGLRHEHFKQILDEKPNIPWLEVHSENFFNRGSSACAFLEDIRSYYPISAHGVGLSLGSADGLKDSHLKKLKEFIDWIKPDLISEHLSWSAIGKNHLPDLLPLPYTQESLKVVCDNVKHVQDYLGRQILVENPSSYLAFDQSDISEWEFLVRVAEQSQCKILFDVNNVFVSAANHKFNATEYIDEMPTELIGEIHLAGHSTQNIEGHEFLIDTHGCRVHDGVWNLYRQTIQKFKQPPPTLIEWDTDIPELSVLIEEMDKANVILQEEK